MKRIVDTLFSTSTIDSLESEGVKRYIISGKCTVADRPNGNNRIYPREVLQTAIIKMREKVGKKIVRMALDHPIGEGRLADVAAILLEVSDIDAEGYGHYKAQLLPNDPQSQKIKNIIDAGSPVGVSTRGYGDALYDQEWPGLPGKYVVIAEGFQLESIDFVDTPSVGETQDDITLESKKRSESTMKTLEELRKEFPEAFVNFDKELADKEASYKTMIDTLKAEAAAHIENIGKLVDAVKVIKPEMFTTVPETVVVAEKNEAIAKIQTQIEAIQTENETLKKQVATVESEKVSIEKDKQIETLKASDPEFFSIPSAVSKFESCISAEEVKKVYESNKALIEDYKKNSTGTSTTQPTKTQPVKPDTQNELTAEQTKHMKSLNIERRVCGMETLTTEAYQKAYPSK